MAGSISIISANVRGFQTNIGDLTHKFIIPHNPDIVACTETFLNSNIPPNYGTVSGYSRWYRRDRVNGNCGGIAVCFRQSLAVQLIPVDMPDHLELMFLKVHGRSPILLCICYRPQWQGSEPIKFLQTHLDALLQENGCSHAIIVGDLNQHLVQVAFDELLTVHGLMNHVDFPTHISGSSLDPVISDLRPDIVSSSQMRTVGSSDHFAVYTQVKTAVEREEGTTRTNWLWDKGDWDNIRADLDKIKWDDVLCGNVDTQVANLNNILLSLQRRYIPSQTYKIKPGDQPWFGYHCRIAADRKSKAWRRYQKHKTSYNKQLYKMACKNMHHVQKKAIERWKKDLQHKLSGQVVGDKVWWKCIKQQQGLCQEDLIPPLTRPDGTVATSNHEKAQLLATHFANKMSVPDPDLLPPHIPMYTKATSSTINIRAATIMKILPRFDLNKTMGPD